MLWLVVFPSLLTGFYLNGPVARKLTLGFVMFTIPKRVRTDSSLPVSFLGPESLLPLLVIGCKCGHCGLYAGAELVSL